MVKKRNNTPTGNLSVMGSFLRIKKGALQSAVSLSSDTQQREVRGRKALPLLTISPAHPPYGIRVGSSLGPRRPSKRAFFAPHILPIMRKCACGTRKTSRLIWRFFPPAFWLLAGAASVFSTRARRPRRSSKRRRGAPFLSTFLFSQRQSACIESIKSGERGALAS